MIRADDPVSFYPATRKITTSMWTMPGYDANSTVSAKQRQFFPEEEGPYRPIHMLCPCNWKPSFSQCLDDISARYSGFPVFLSF